MDTRIFVSKKEQFRVESDSLCNELKTSLSLDANLNLTLYNIYDIFNADETDIQLLKENVCSEVVTDTVFDAVDLKDKKYLAYEYLPGQYDQRADSAMQCLMLLNNKKTVRIHSGTLLVFEGKISDEQLSQVEHYIVNPVEARVKDLSVLEDDQNVDFEDVPVISGFIDKSKEELGELRNSLGLAMSFEDIVHVQKYFKEEEIEEIIERYQQINLDLHYTMLKEIDHATELLETLKKDGYHLGIVSNKRIKAVELGVQVNHFEPYFDVLLGKEDLPIPKPSGTGLIEACSRMNVSRDNVIYVGDAKSDILSAKDVAMISVGFSKDEDRIEQMNQANPDYIIRDLRDLISICKEKRTWNDTSIW